jgi:hypothetical protein
LKPCENPQSLSFLGREMFPEVAVSVHFAPKWGKVANIDADGILRELAQRKGRILTRSVVAGSGWQSGLEMRAEFTGDACKSCWPI